MPGLHGFLVKVVCSPKGVGSPLGLRAGVWVPEIYKLKLLIRAAQAMSIRHVRKISLLVSKCLDDKCIAKALIFFC